MVRLPRQAPAALALVAGIATSTLAYAILTARPAPAATAQLPMVVARGVLDETRPISPADVAIVRVSERPKGAYADPAEVVGRLPLVPVPAGQPLLTSHLAATGTQADLWRQVPTGKRAITLGLNEVAGVGGFVKPGMRVDVIGVARDGNTWASDTVAQDLQVLAVAQDDKHASEAKAKVASSATLLVNPDQAEAISLAGERGAVRLVLRGPNDHKVKKRTVKPPPPPAPPPQGGRTLAMTELPPPSR
ncbi:MAG: Flp pilus assembly protein CpaB, partial [Cyanobacteria bacterium RYN_339]|nr:Flp pilus assembly protein CpaB [Cyanobacteria bacterium RYN_339]